MPPTTGPGFKAFHDHLIQAASADLERLHPVWVSYIRHAPLHDVARQLSTVPPNYKASRFKKYRELLSLVMDFELHLRHLSALSRLLEKEPDPATLGELGVNEDEWANILNFSNAIALYGLFDRTERIVKRSCRLLIGSYDKQTVGSEQVRLVKTVIDLREQAGKVRHPVAHGMLDEPLTGPAGALLDPGHWEVPMARGEWTSLDNFRRASNPDLLTTAQRFELETKSMAVAVIGVDRTFGELDAAVDWRRVRAA